MGKSLPVGPGFLGFLVVFTLALVLWFLLRNMNSRMRRMAYRERERQEQLDAAERPVPQAKPEGDGVAPDRQPPDAG